VLVALGLALARTYRVAVGDFLGDDSGWLTFVAVWLPVAVLLGVGVVYVWPALVWRLRGERAAASAGRKRRIGAAGSPIAWIAALALALSAGYWFAEGDLVMGAIAGVLAVASLWLGGPTTAGD